MSIEMNKNYSEENNTRKSSTIDNKNDLVDNDDIVVEEERTKNNSFIGNQGKDGYNEKPVNNEEGGNNVEIIERSEIKVENNQDYDENGKKLSKAKKFVNQKLKVPPRLFKTFIVTSILALLGVILIILGCIEQIAENTPGRGVMFWVLGIIVIIPGGFYSYQFYRAKKAKTEFQRDDIFEDIPEL